MPLNQTDIPVGISEKEYTQLLNEEHLGNWWLPENSERKIPGVLSFDQDHRATLQLIEAFEVTLDRQMQAGIDYPFVLGQDRSGRNFAMTNCWKEGGTTSLLSGRSWSTVRSHRVLIGLPDGFDAGLPFSSLELRSPSFSQWWTSGASQLTTRTSRKHVSVTLKVHRPPPVHLCTWKGISVDFVSRPMTGAALQGTRQLVVNEDICLRMTSEHERPLSEFLTHCDRICAFMAVLLQCYATMPSVAAYTITHAMTVDGGPHFLLPVIVVSPLAGCTTVPRGDRETGCLLPVQTSRPLLTRMLRRWSAHYSELEDVRGVLLGSERLQHSFSHHRLAMAVAALEGLDRIGKRNNVWTLSDWRERMYNAINPAAPVGVQQWARGYLAHSNEPTLRSRLKRQFRDCAHVLSMTPRQYNSCIQECVTVRVQTAHSLAHVPLDRQSATRMVQSTNQVEAVLLVSLLKYLGCTDEELQAAAARDPLAWQLIQSVFHTS